MNLMYGGLVFAQIVTFAAYAVVTAGAALLQQRVGAVNDMLFPAGLKESDPETYAANLAAYQDAFQSTTYMVPYPGRGRYQFQYEWWIIEMEFAIFALTAFLTIFPRFIPRARPVALTFLASALVLVMDNINAIWWLLRNDLAKTLFHEHRIATAQAGLLMVGIGNSLTIIFMGLYEHVHHTDATITMTSPAQKQVAHV